MYFVGFGLVLVLADVFAVVLVVILSHYSITNYDSNMTKEAIIFRITKCEKLVVVVVVVLAVVLVIIHGVSENEFLYGQTPPPCCHICCHQWGV